MKTIKKKKLTKQKKTTKALAIAKAPVVALAKVQEGAKLSNLETVLIGGDLAVLTQDERFNYYVDVCKSLQLNPLTQPFGYVSLEGKMVLYAKKDCAEQLRKIHGVGITSLKRTIDGDYCYVDVTAQDKYGKVDASTGVLYMCKRNGSNWEAFKGKERADAIMKCETKAKRRVTLSICGLSMPDESEIMNLDGAKVLKQAEAVTAEALEKVEEKPVTAPQTAQTAPSAPKAQPVQAELVETEAQKHIRLVRAFPPELQALLKQADFNTVEKAWSAYDKCEGDLDALKQLCNEVIRKKK